MINKISRFLDIKSNILGHDDDAVAILIDESKYMILNIDGWVESTDRPAGLSLFSSGYRAVINAASDLIAKQVKPQFMAVSLTITQNHQSKFNQIINGIVTAAKKYDIKYLGGDLNSGSDLVIDITIWSMSNTKPISRKGAEVGDSVYWLGPPLGETNVALKILLGELQGDNNQALEIFSNPSLYEEFLYLNNVNASIDCSDGLARSIDLLANSSQVGINLNNLKTTSEWVNSCVKINNTPLDDLILYGGEELGVIFTTKPSNIIDSKAIKIGEVIRKNGIYLKHIPIPNKGWDHFI